MTNKEIRDLTSEELLKKIEESKEELFNLRFNQATGNLEKPSRLRELRKRKGINQEKLAELIDVDPTTISNIGNGKNYPSMINLENLLNVLDCSFIEAFDFEHKNTNENLLKEINLILTTNPEKIEDFYKIAKALTK